MNLAHLLLGLKEQLDLELGLAHVNHGQRPEATEEATYLETFAKEHGLAFHLAHFQGRFSEATARRFRYDFFAEVMAESGYTCLVTAHHADDQAETVLMRLLRGSRWFHLAAISECRPFAGGELIRPLLSFKKAELLPVFHFEDSSNASSDFLRNRVRKTYLPQLIRENPQLPNALCTLSDEVADVTATLDYLLAEKDYQDLATFRQLPQSVQRVVLTRYLAQFPDLQLGQSQFHQLLTWLQTKTNEILPLKSDYELIIDYNRFAIDKIQLRTDDLDAESVIKSGDIVEFAGYRLGFDLPLKDADMVLALPRKVPVTLRHRQEGDSILYQGHRRLLRRLFIAKKIPLKEREKAVLVLQDGKILGILEIATGDLSKSLKNDTIEGRLYIKKMKETVC